MHTDRFFRWAFQHAVIAICLTALFCLNITTALAGEERYQNLSRAARDKEAMLFRQLAAQGGRIDWEAAVRVKFEGNLRFLEAQGLAPEYGSGLYLVRHLAGQLYIVSIPSPAELEQAGIAETYKGLEQLLGNKLFFDAQLAETEIDSERYTFIRFSERPGQLMLDRIFKFSIMLMFFFVMLGMGMNLSPADFRIVFQRPKGILIGIFLQWILMPLLALAMAYALGFYHNFPFIYAGLVLICACPGGVTSNLMTYYAKGDLALSVSLTSLSTVMALFFTPFILALFSANIPDIDVPAALIVQTIIGLVLVPLVLGMSVRGKWLTFAIKATPFFSALGVFALLTVIGVGIITNAEKFADTDRYSLLFYLMVVSLSLLGMLLAAVFPRLFKIDNYQARAISLEVGLRNSTLAVTIALLIQDLMGDFHSSMFVTTAIYGITMYMTGFLMIAFYNKLLPMRIAGNPSVASAPGKI
jgi:bile acid:Na+ symporter, BASS family